MHVAELNMGQPLRGPAVASEGDAVIACNLILEVLAEWIQQALMHVSDGMEQARGNVSGTLYSIPHCKPDFAVPG